MTDINTLTPANQALDIINAKLDESEVGDGIEANKLFRLDSEGKIPSDLTSGFALKDTPKNIAFVMKNPVSNEQSASLKLKSSKILNEIDILANTAPSASTTIDIYANTTSIASASFSTASRNLVLSPAVNLSAGDVIYAKFNGAVNGISLVTVQLTLKDN